jgi:hypothetical protein
MTVLSRTDLCLLPNQTFYIPDSKNAYAVNVFSVPLQWCQQCLWHCDNDPGSSVYLPAVSLSVQ